MDTSLRRIFGELLSQPRPKVLNFQVNDICNARCVMCNIWKNKRSKELGPEEFLGLLRHPFFQDVQHAGITGGEPTLRGDLARFYEGMLTALPKFVGGSFITNGFKSNEGIATYTAVHRLYVATGKNFGGMVSIDGVGEVHDRVRGKTGAFTKASATLFGLRDAGVPVHAACTIVKSNVWHVDELLAWGRKNGVYMRFRLGEHIRRLYNLDDRKEIRAFDEAETKHLVSFFHKLVLLYETQEDIKLTYQSILSILTGGQRIITCPYQTSQSLNLDSQARFAICAPRGRPIALGGNPEQRSRRIIERLSTRVLHCPNCIHDYHGRLTADESTRRSRAAQTAARLASTPPSPVPVATASDRPLRRLLIAGWYGTETTGDIAILGGLLQRYRAKGVTDFTVLSLYPDYSKVTLPPLAAEIGVPLNVRGYDDPSTLDHLARFDAVSMGGGPLMDIEPTELIRNLFRAARALGLPCYIDGCGIGPLHQPRFQDVVGEILQLASEIRLRDETSARMARMLSDNAAISVVPDPSTHYLQSQGVKWRPTPNRIIRGWFRMLTPEYPQSTTPHEATELLLGFLRRLLDWYPEHQLELGAMHWFPVGWDDREFASELRERLANPRVRVEMAPRSPKQVLGLMAEAEFNLCMRFHSVVFAHSIAAPYVAFDYTAGGKVASFVSAAGNGGKELRFPDLATLTHAGLLGRMCRPSDAAIQ